MKIGQELRPDFSWWNKDLDLRGESFAAFIGALLVIPQGVVFSYLAGVPPEHGIFCAIVVTFLASLFGRSIIMSGPNTATSILIGISVLPFAGRESPLFVELVLLLSLIVGVIQLLIWLFRGAKVFQYLSSATITGITTGVGCLIMLASINGIMGLATIKANFFFERLWIIVTQGYELVNIYALIVGVATLLSGFLAARKWPRYFIFAALLAGTLTSTLIGWLLPQSMTELNFLGGLYMDWSKIGAPKMNMDYLLIGLQMIPSAFAIAFLSLSQSLVIASDLHRKGFKHIDLNKEAFAMGLANFAAPFFSAYAGSGSFNRTQVSEDMQVKTPFAGLLTGVFVLLIILLVGHLFYLLPMATIAGVLFIVGYRMIKWSKIKSLMAEPFSRWSFILVLFCVLFVGLVSAIVLAIGISILAVLKNNK